MEKKERLKEAFDYLRSKGEVHTQADIADRMNASRPNVSSAFKGDVKCLTDKFLIRFNKAFGDIFRVDWLLTGEGSMLRPTSIEQKVGDVKNSTLKEVNVIKSGETAVLKERIKFLQQLLEEKERTIKILMDKK